MQPRLLAIDQFLLAWLRHHGDWENVAFAIALEILINFFFVVSWH